MECYIFHLRRLGLGHQSINMEQRNLHWETVLWGEKSDTVDVIRREYIKVPYRKRKPMIQSTSEKEKVKKTHSCSNKKCNESFNRQTDLQRHVKAVHEKSKTHICKFCNRSFSEKYNRDRHEKCVHIDPKHPCVKCNLPFTHAYMLRNHMKQCHEH